MTTTPRSEISWLDPGIPPAPDSSACHAVLREMGLLLGIDNHIIGHLLVPVFRSYSLRRSTTQPQRILIVVDVRHLLVIPVPPVVLADVSLWMRPPHPIDLMMDLTLGRPAMAVVAGALASLIILMRMVPTMTSTRRHFSTLSRPPVSLCLSNAGDSENRIVEKL